MQSNQAKTTTPLAPLHRQIWPVVVAGVLVLITTAGGVYLLVARPTAFKHVATQSAKPVPPPPPAASQHNQPPPVAPQPAPPPPPAAPVIEAAPPPPPAAPTTQLPRTVTITSQNGIWLRSSPDSSNQNNVIGWIPHGAQVSVDQTGDFWWHGTYRGQTGYFASQYTK